MTISLEDVTFQCSAPSENVGNETCSVTGKDVLVLYNMNVETKTYFLAMLGCVLAYRLLAYVALRLKVR